MKSAAKPAAEQAAAVVPAEQLPKEVTHTIQMEDVQRDTLEVEEQKTLTDREVTLFSLRRGGFVSTGVCLSLCLFVCLSVSNFA